MTDKFQIVGSLLRPDELLKYKTQIEHRDDIQYPFYQNFEGYEECETKAIKQVVKKEIEHDLSIITDGEFCLNRCGIWILCGALVALSVILQIMAIFSVMLTANQNMKHAKILAYALRVN